ncbi:hypothetical protein RvY_15054 [Ramazzottius varieornatus]|uniref:Uncharacterized protein n=1 Tax=Ramazzottius varieornatus TaxID=947166 RepID=A0A1D1W0J9_RAMVA|nr:hypothetical protein RvY_15054 [Ramazzottius varieornatus]
MAKLLSGTSNRSSVLTKPRRRRRGGSGFEIDGFNLTLYGGVLKDESTLQRTFGPHFQRWCL